MSESQRPGLGGLGGLRVLLVMGTTGGGVGRHVRSLAASLTKAGHQVIIAAPPGTDQALDLPGSGARFEPVQVHDRPHPLRVLSAVRAIARLAREADVVHAHGLRAGGLASLTDLTDLTGRTRRARQGRPGGRGGGSHPPLVVTLHNALVVGGGGRAKAGAVALAYAVLERLVARRADVVLGVSQDLEDRMSELGAAHVRHAVIPAPESRSATRTRSQVRDDLGVQDRDLVVCVARLAEQKGLPLLLDAAGRLAGPGAPLVVVAGDGPLRGSVQARIDAERLPVRLLGWRDDVPNLLAAADLVVSTAVWEGQPIAVQQALRAGAAIVATDVGGTAAVTGNAAVLVGYGDAPGLARQIRRLLADTQARSDLAGRARIRAQQLPDDVDARDAVVAVYRALVSAERLT